MIRNKPFRARSEKYWLNIEGGLLTHARAGLMDKPDGTTEPAVIIFRDKFVLAILSIEDALRVSNQLVDSVERPIRNG